MFPSHQSAVWVVDIANCVKSLDDFPDRKYFAHLILRHYGLYQVEILEMRRTDLIIELGCSVVEAKTIEIRDRMTFIPAVAVRITGSREDRLMWRAGYDDRGQVALIYLTKGTMHLEPFGWRDRTMFTAHKYLIENWDRIQNGEVVDVEFILEETLDPKESELNELRQSLPALRTS